MKITDNSREIPAAAVAIIEIVRQERILILRRATRPDDHWSGHYSFPGGRREQEDPSLMATAIRETQEETGISLTEKNLLQALEPTPAGRSKPQPLWVQPFYFQLEKPPTLQLDAQEVQAAHWLDLTAFRAPEGHGMREMLPHRVPGKLYPAWPLGDYYLWGFTYELLQKIATVKVPRTSCGEEGL